MMGRRLRTRVHLADEQGKNFVFGPDSEVPEWAAAKITNPKAWADDADDSAEPAAPVKEPANPNAEPPRKGKGSSREAWVTYAMTQGFEVPDDASQSDIIASIDADRAQRAAEGK